MNKIGVSDHKVEEQKVAPTTLRHNKGHGASSLGNNGTIRALCKLRGKIIVKRATQVNGHSLKLHFYIFEKTQGKHNSLDCHKFVWNNIH
jgi:hypothetical protein